MTEKLFYQDSYQKTFTATVISCEPTGEMYKAVLNRTAFFPEGGGQYADTGTIHGIPVADVREKDGIIYHYIKEKLDTGTEVVGEIEWEKRYSKMQQHTAEHIVSGLVHRHYGYDNVGFHLADTYCTMDLSGPLTKEDLRKIEFEANQAIYANVDVGVSYPSKEELAHLEYRSKIEIEGQVRIVSIPEYDVCACCAPHVKKTGEIGIIKFVQSQNYKGGVRITMLSGDRAFWDYCKKEESVRSIMGSLAASEDAVAQAVEHLKEENAALKQKILELQKKSLQETANKVSRESYAVCLFEKELDKALPRILMNLVLDKEVKICAVLNEIEENTYQYVIGSREIDLRQLCKCLNENFDGRGGGKAEMVQGTLHGEKTEIEKKFYFETGIIGK